MTYDPLFTEFTRELGAAHVTTWFRSVAGLDEPAGKTRSYQPATRETRGQSR